MDWISVDERLPEKMTTVLVEGGIAQYRGSKVGWVSGTWIEWPGRPICWDVTEWMPLPVPPKAEP